MVIPSQAGLPDAGRDASIEFGHLLQGARRPTQGLASTIALQQL
jgi:hypothetical protein